MRVLSTKMLEMKESSVRKLTSYGNAAEAAAKHVYKLNIGQPDLKTPVEYYQNIRNYDNPVIEYMPSNGTPELIKAIEKYYRETGIRVTKSHIAVTTGGSEAMLFALLAITNPGDEVIVFEPYYSNYSTFFSISGMTPVAVRTLPSQGFHIDIDTLEAALTEKTKAIIVTNPGNPTGAVMSQQEIRGIADFAMKHDLYIIADEVYREIVFDGRAIVSFGFMEDIWDRLILIDSVSKRFNACGARIGFLVSKNKEIMKLISKLCQGRLAVSTVEQAGALGLFSSGPHTIQTVRDEFQRRRDAVYESLMKIPGIVCQKPEGAFYMMAELPVDDACKFLIWMLEEFDEGGETVMAAPADGFYLHPEFGKRQIRIAYVLEPNKLVHAIWLMGLGISRYPGRIPA